MPDPSSPLARLPGPAVADTARRLQMLAAVARRTGNAVIVTGVDGVIEWVNEGFTRLTEFTPEEVLGKRPGQFLQGQETSAESRAAMSAAIRERRPFRVVVLNYARSGRQYWVRVEAEPTFDDQGRFNGYIALETDVTERRIAEGREAVTKRVGDLLLSCDSIESAARIVTDELVRTLDVRAAQVWTVVPGVVHLRYEAGAIALPEAQAWVDATRGNTFQRGTEWVVGVGAPGAAWGTGQVCIKTDFWQKDTNGQFSRRAAAARAAGIRTVCSVPVHGTDGVVAVIEIGGSHTYPGHEQLPSLVERVAQQLGAFILREQSRRSFEAIFRHSPDAVLVVDSAGTVSRTNARATVLFGEVEGRPLDSLLEGGAALLLRDQAASDKLATSTHESDAESAVELHTSTAHGRNGPFPAEVSLSTTRSTGAPAHIVAVRDLTERMRAEEQLRRSLEE